MKTQPKLHSINSGNQLLSFFKQYFDDLPDHRKENSTMIPLGDALMSAYAMFSLKAPSALQFEEEFRRKQEKSKKHNLKAMFGVKQVPSDTQMRTIVDEVPTSIFGGIYKEIFKKIQRDKKLEPFEFIKINGVPHYLLLADGTEFFSSNEICCESCNVKTQKKINKKTGETTEIKTYSHQMLNTVLAHPNMKTVIPLMGEPIVKQDGSQKFDCELNALKRFLKRFRKEHPKLKVILVLDALYATGSLIKLLKQYDIKFILNVKPGKNTTLFNIINTKDKINHIKHHDFCEEIGEKIKKQVEHKYRYTNSVAIDNESSRELKVNFIEYWKTTNWVNTKKKECEEKRHFSWVTDINLDKSTIKTIMRGGRARWSIENEVFNTLKNHGYNYDRNYGHGYKNLANNFAMLMMLSFFFDQVLEMCSKQFKTLLKKCGRKSKIWEKFRFYYEEFLIESWDFLVDFMIKAASSYIPLNTS